VNLRGRNQKVHAEARRLHGYFFAASRAPWRESLFKEMHAGVEMHELDDITGAIIDSAMKIHKELGPGLLESVYEVVLARALEGRAFHVERQKPIRFEYDGMVFEDGFRVDLLVDERVVVELKSVEKLAPVHSKQLLTYLRLMNLPVGLLINFSGVTLREGLHRIVNQLPSSASPRLRVNQSNQLPPSASPSLRVNQPDHHPSSTSPRLRANHPDGEQ
jgi:iron complex transport system substrate-binding protein